MDISLSPDGIGFDGTKLLLTTSYTESVAQRLSIRLKSNLGAWFLNRGYGVDWFNQIFGKNRSKLTIDAILRLAITQEPTVLRIVSYESSIDKTRKYSAKFLVQAVGIVETIPLTLIVNENDIAIVTESDLYLTL